MSENSTENAPEPENVDVEGHYIGMRGQQPEDDVEGHGGYGLRIDGPDEDDVPGT